MKQILDEELEYMSDEQLLTRTEQMNNEYMVKAYFNSQNYIPDNISRVYPKNVIIKLEDIKKLNSSIIEKLNIHRELGFVISVDVQYDNRQTYHFGRWDDFENFDLSSPGISISNIVLTWKINVIFEGLETAQPHILTVKLSNGMKPGEMMSLLLSGNLDDVSELENNFFPIVSQCTYTDRRFGNELINLVSEWAETVKIDSWLDNNIIKLLKKHKVKIAKVFEHVTALIIFLGTSSAFLEFTNRTLSADILSINKVEIIAIIKSFLYLMISWNIAPAIGKWFGKTMFSFIDDYGSNYIFAITNYDKQRQDKMQKQKKYDVLKICGTIMLNIGVNVFFIYLDRWI